MTCSNCAESVRRALAESAGGQSAEVSLASGWIIVTGDNLEREQLTAAVTALGYAAKVPDRVKQPTSDSLQK